MLINYKQTKKTWLLYKYMPTSGHKDEVEVAHEQLEVMDNVKKNDNLIILGD